MRSAWLMSGGERQKTSVIFFFFFFPSIFSRRKKVFAGGREYIVIQRARAPDMAESGSAFFIIFFLSSPRVYKWTPPRVKWWKGKKEKNEIFVNQKKTKKIRVCEMWEGWCASKLIIPSAAAPSSSSFGPEQQQQHAKAKKKNAVTQKKKNRYKITTTIFHHFLFSGALFKKISNFRKSLKQHFFELI